MVLWAGAYDGLLPRMFMEVTATGEQC